jgi:hypothetical protein
MSTRSRIAYRQPDGTIRSIYCHWDGHPSNIGRVLIDHYSNIDTLVSLLDRGAHSTLGLTSEEAEAYADHGEDCPAQISSDRDELSKIDWGEEYMYLYEPSISEWVYMDVDRGRDSWDLLCGGTPIPQ